MPLTIRGLWNTIHLYLFICIYIFCKPLIFSLEVKKQTYTKRCCSWTRDLGSPGEVLKSTFKWKQYKIYYDIAERSAFNILSFCLLFVSRQKVSRGLGRKPHYQNLRKLSNFLNTCVYAGFYFIKNTKQR